MQLKSLLIGCFFLVTFSLCGQQQYVDRTAHIHVEAANNFFDLVSDNYQVSSILDRETGKVNFLGLLKSFEFQVGGLDRVFNSKLTETLYHPKFKYIGNITNIGSVNFDRPGKYPVTYEGILYVWDEKRITPGKGTIEISTDGTISIYSDLSFMIEEASMEKANMLMKRYLPPGVAIDVENLGISRQVHVEIKGTYKKRMTSSSSTITNE